MESVAELTGASWGGAGRRGHSRWQRGQVSVGALCGESSLDA
jgi:hypothetical protein